MGTAWAPPSKAFSTPEADKSATSVTCSEPRNKGAQWRRLENGPTPDQLETGCDSGTTNQRIGKMCPRGQREPRPPCPWEAPLTSGRTCLRGGRLLRSCVRKASPGETSGLPERSTWARGQRGPHGSPKLVPKWGVGRGERVTVLLSQENTRRKGVLRPHVGPGAPCTEHSGLPTAICTLTLNSAGCPRARRPQGAPTLERTPHKRKAPTARRWGGESSPAPPAFHTPSGAFPPHPENAQPK